MFASRQGEFYLLGIVFGTAYSGVMPLYAVLAREYFDQRLMGTVFGAAIMLSSVGMALGPVAGGWIFDTYHDYRWLYLSSTAIALAATAVAFTFPPLPRAQPEQWPLDVSPIIIAAARHRVSCGLKLGRPLNNCPRRLPRVEGSSPSLSTNRIRGDTERHRQMVFAVSAP